MPSASRLVALAATVFSAATLASCGEAAPPPPPNDPQIGPGSSGGSGGAAGGGGEATGCTPATCATGMYCDLGTASCLPGCDADDDCAGAKCDFASHTCGACDADADCPAGQLCTNGVCAPGCNEMKPCPSGLACCDGGCVEVLSDAKHCGSCGASCTTLPNSVPVCNVGLCDTTCAAGWLDCNGDYQDGCEWNEKAQGACSCTPGETKSCYLGAPGTEGVGPCHAGTRTCDASGTTWGPCEGQVVPIPEICNGIDDNCNNAVDDGDYDGDGYPTCDDCCDIANGSCPDPKLVNPGAYEFLGNGVDDDCDPATSDSTPPEACSASEKFAGVTAGDLAAAMELCPTSPEFPASPKEKRWGVVEASLRLANGTMPNATQLSDMENWQAAVLRLYGQVVAPKQNATMGAISTGRMRDNCKDPGLLCLFPDDGFVSPNGGTQFNSSSMPPADYLMAHNGNLPSSAGCNGNCPAGNGANDSINVRLRIRAPTNAKSFSYDFRFFSAEFPEWTCTQYNDFYLTQYTSGAAGIPVDKNISFDSLGNAVSVNNGFFDVCTPSGCYGCPAGPGDLAKTGMESNVGGGTKWLTTDAPVVPGELLTIEFMVFDVSDFAWDSLTLLDNWRWTQLPAEVGTHE